ncbi:MULTISPECIES: ribonuclease T2 [Microvirga]|uniref:ribonuclease T2 n=1 Tax=Microvirga TaxID=186650 RepID=UPI001CFD4A15|nr:ribonuclease T2 [Microvirga lenta]MCB5173799.1 ribonuclease T2 [Microvirga lenta]
MIRRRCLALAGALWLAVLPATAQPVREVRGAPAGAFDFYVLALSWSPGFCETSGSAGKRRQCDEGSGLGFVVHGLWPQNEQGYPSFCEPGGRFAPRAAVEEASGLFPDDNLARYQWRKHGTCTGESPSGYFRAVRRARELVRIPDSFSNVTSGAKVMPVEVERAFAAANPNLRPDMIAVSCGRRVLQEVRICLDRDLRGFRTCPEVDRSGCRAGEVTIPPVR